MFPNITRRTSQRRIRRPSPCRLTLERLEDRSLPASFGFALEPGSPYGYAVATDGAGNTYVPTGTYLRKFSSTGQELWYANYGGLSLQGPGVIGGSGIAWGQAIAVDAAGNAYVAGGGGNGGSGSIEKFSNSGQLIWVRTLTTSNPEDPYGSISVGISGLALDPAGHVYVTGGFTTGDTYTHHLTLTLWSGAAFQPPPDAGSPQEQNEQPDNDQDAPDEVPFATGTPLNLYQPYSWGSGGFVVELDGNGQLLWQGGLLNTGPGPGPYSVNVQPSGVATDAAGNVYLAGSFAGTVNFDPSGGSHLLASASATGGSPANSPDAFIMKLNAAHQLVWAEDQTGGGNGYDSANGITADAGGNVYVTGYRRSYGFVEKIDTNGALQWQTTAFSAQGLAIALGSSGDVYATGFFSGTVDFGARILQSQGDSDGFVWQLDANGNPIWAGSMGGANTDVAGRGIAVDSAGDIFTAGTMQARFPDVPEFGVTPVNFDPGPGVFDLEANTLGLAFLLKLLPSPPPTVNVLTEAGVFNEVPIPVPVDAPGGLLGLTGLTAGSDGNLWFTEYNVGKIGRLTPGGSVTEFPLPTGGFGQPTTITDGPDGNLWATENAATYPGPANHIDRITPAGTITSFPVPTLYSAPTGITEGPDGNLWFTEDYGYRIGRITLQGVVTEFPVGGFPTAITAGPDGNLWFTEFLGNKIGRITPQGTITEFPVPTIGSGPDGITLGPDGNLWFTELDSGNVGRVTPDGIITEFPISATPYLVRPAGIITGPDGNLWIAEAGENAIVQLTTAGQVTQLLVPTANSRPLALVVGPNGNIWFTEINSNKIGELSPNQPPTANAGGPYAIYAGNSLTLDASASSDPDGDALTYSWTINGYASAATGVSPKLTWLQLQALGIGPGTFQISVQVDDGHGNVATSAVTTLTVQHVPTAVTLTAPPVTYGADGIVSVAVTSTLAPATPTGTVSLTVDSTSYSGTLNGGTATFDVGILRAGDHSLAASYAAQDIFAASTATGTLHVNQAPLTLSADNKSMVYGGAPSTLTVSSIGFVNGDTSSSLTTQPTMATNATPTSHAGSYSITVGGAVDPNYAISYVSGTLTVTPAALTIVADNKSMVYGGVFPTLTASYSGFVNGDMPASLSTPVSLNTAATAASHVAGSPYTITAGGAVDPDYTISYVPGTLTVTPAKLIVSADNPTKVYGAPLPTLTASYNGFVNGDTTASLTSPLALATAATQTSDVVAGGYPITLSGAADPDYAISYVNGTLTVTRAALTVTVANASKVYGLDDSSSLTGAISGIQNGDPITAAYSSSGSGAGAAPGVYAIDAVLSDGGAGRLARDYDVKILPGTLTVSHDSTTTQLTSSANASNYGQAVTFTANVMANAPGSGTPTGSVTFYDGSSMLATVDLSGGMATFTTTPTALAAGTHTMTVRYNGDADFLASTSAVLTQTVLSAQQQTALLIGQVNSLVSGGVLGSGNGNALNAKLNDAIVNLDAGNITAGVNQLNAFINQVNALVRSRRLTTDQAQQLIDAANQAIASALA